ncbi:MAG TPA: hypothetical protein VMY98_10265 [Anaerolineae bacterium]|nr:hypothetical protein [Anaerolineae bacterium]
MFTQLLFRPLAMQAYLFLCGNPGVNRGRVLTAQQLADGVTSGYSLNKVRDVIELLHSLGLIVSEAHGPLPERIRYGAWRLSPRGKQVLEVIEKWAGFTQRHVSNLPQRQKGQ